MSLMKTLARVVIGVAVAKGAATAKRSGDAKPPVDGGLLGQLHYRLPTTGGSIDRADIERMLGDVLGGGAGSTGLGGLLESLGDGVTDATGGGRDEGLNGLLDGLAGVGAMSGMMGGLVTGGTATAQPRGGFGDMLNQAIARQDEPDMAPTPEQELAAGLMLRAVLQAARCAGTFDEAEQGRLLDGLGDVSRQEQAFVQAELRAPVEAAGLAGQVPQGLEAQVYAMSAMAIDPDNPAEAQYLRDLARALNLHGPAVTHIHARLGVAAPDT